MAASLCRVGPGDTLLAVRAPSGTQLEVPLPEAAVNGQRSYQVHLRSSSGPIEVLLLNKDPVSSAPVVLQVPPPEDGFPAQSGQTTPTKTDVATPTASSVGSSDSGSGLTSVTLSSSCDNTVTKQDDTLSFLVLAASPPLAPRRGDHDYIYSLDDSEGLCDLFDVPIFLTEPEEKETCETTTSYFYV
uniref:E2F transcription factor CC-MB domain-containing protein n=1 Tax=Denticeps clupeoides TaxID=299321 RepID=A0AAY4BSG9_9TELE